MRDRREGLKEFLGIGRRPWGAEEWASTILFGVLALVLLVLVPYGLSWWLGVLVFMLGLAAVQRVVERLVRAVARHPRFAKYFTRAS